MARKGIPRDDDGFLGWTRNFITIASEEPLEIGLTPLVISQYQTAQVAYAEALTRAQNPGTRGVASVFDKNEKKKALLELTQRVAAQVDATMMIVTDQMRQALGLTIRDHEPTPAPILTQPPLLELVGVIGSVVTVRARDKTSTERRGKIPGASGVSFLSFVGEELPTDFRLWHQEFSTGRTTAAIDFGENLPTLSKVWVTAFWFNARKESSPAATPISTFVVNSLVRRAA